jgi:probable F420-dependent oxidoreductase
MARARSCEEVFACARRAEELGYDILQSPDHLTAQLSPIAAMTFAAAATSRLRVGSYVFAVDFRHPLMLARDVHSLHVLSEGRFELGMGAGWDVSDYEKLGRTYDPVGRRIDRLTEAVSLVKRLLAGEVVDHDGPNYPMRGAYAGPPPVRGTRPRILIGGSCPRILGLAAREADIVGLHPRFNASRRARLGEASDEGTARKIAIVREEAGLRFDQLEFNVMIGHAALTDSRRPTRSSIAASTRSAATALAGTSYVLRGTVSQLTEQLLRRRDRLGISYYSIPAHAMEEMAPLVGALSGR